MNPSDLQQAKGALEHLRTVCRELQTQMSSVLIGQEEVIRLLLTGLMSGGHMLVIGVPGLAKTMMVKALAELLGWEFRRIQFTPDLMPSDITGTEILQADESGQRRTLIFHKGPVFANLILADEINRTPPKTQAALLEAMQEHRVTAAGHTYELAPPFFVLATQNPIEQEGTYPLPEAQLDRFMFLIQVDYPDLAEEGRIARETTGGALPALVKLVDGQRVLAFQELVRRVPVPDHVYDFAVELARRTRPGTNGAPDWVKNWVSWGAGPRAVQSMVVGGKARAAMLGSYLVRREDIEAIAEPVLRHRVLTNFHAESEGVTSRDIVARLLKEMAAS